MPTELPVSFDGVTHKLDIGRECRHMTPKDALKPLVVFANLVIRAR